MKRFALFLAVALSLSSCGTFLLHDSFSGDDWFYLENKSTVMPVWVTGNIESKVFIIWIHGGPGDAATFMPLTDVFKELHDDYALVYWDQRGSGLSQGNARPDDYYMEQFVEDLERLIALVRYRYSNPTLFLMGSSWGGTLGTAFLAKPENQAHISGFISVSGAFSLRDSIRLSREWTMEMASRQIALNIDVGYWRQELAWYRHNQRVPSNALGRHWRNIDNLDGYIINYSNASANMPFSSFIFFSPSSLAYYRNHDFMQPKMWPWLAHIDLLPEMQNIKIPALVLGGRHDGAVPFQIAEMGFDSLGTNSTRKSLYIFENSAHSFFWEEPDIFVFLVREFVQTNIGNKDY
ncbi:MAG: alpha/beta hydrolase [Treponema sp.]|nr:alpha/beta hydrolase [Treponema sp.]